MPTVYKEVEVYVDLTDFSTEELVQELENRNEVDQIPDTVKELVNAIWSKRRLNKDFSQELDQLIYEVEGRIL